MRHPLFSSACWSAQDRLSAVDRFSRDEWPHAARRVCAVAVGTRATRWRTQGRTVTTSPAARWKRRWKWSTSPGGISASCSATTTTTWTRFRAHAFRWQPQSRQSRAAALGTFRFRVAALSGIHRQRNVKDCAFSASRFKNSRPRPTSLLDFIRSAPPQAGGAR